MATEQASRESLEGLGAAQGHRLGPWEQAWPGGEVRARCQNGGCWASAYELVDYRAPLGPAYGLVRGASPLLRDRCHGGADDPEA